MLRWFKKTKKEEDPAEVIDATLIEMEGAIRTSIASLNQLAKNYKDIQDKVATLQYEAHNLGKDALKAVRQGREMDAKQILAKKADAEAQAKQYQQIAHEMEASMRKLEKQVSKMKVQLDETKSKRAVLMAEYANAKTQKELAQKLQDLNIQTDVFEESIIQTQIEAGLEGEQEDPLLKEFEALNTSDSSIDKLKLEAAAEEKRLKEIQEANKQKQMEILFGKDFATPKEKLEEKQNKNKILEGFFQETESKPKEDILGFFDTPQKEKSKVEDFFKEKKIEEISLEDFFDKENQLRINIDSFFSESKHTNPKQEELSQQDQQELDELEKKWASIWESEKKQNDTKQDIRTKFDEFFNQEKDDKKKKIDDFFNS
jgi:phage shock protein A